MPRNPGNESRDIRYLKDILAALPAEIQMMNRYIEQGMYVQPIYSQIDKDNVDILVFDTNRTKPDKNEFYVYAFDVKQINNRGGQFPRGFKENTIIFETKGRNGSLGWGLHPKPQNRYIAIVDGYGWNFDLDALCGELKTIMEFEAKMIHLQQQVVEMFTRTPGQLTHSYYVFDLEGLQDFYFKHINDSEIMPFGRNGGEGSEYRKIPLSRYAEEGFGYSYWERNIDCWVRTTDGTCGEKPPIPGTRLFNLYTGQEYFQEEVSNQMQRLQEALTMQQDQYTIQQKAYHEKGFASKQECINYIGLKEAFKTLWNKVILMIIYNH